MYLRIFLAAVVIAHRILLRERHLALALLELRRRVHWSIAHLVRRGVGDFVAHVGFLVADTSSLMWFGIVRDECAVVLAGVIGCCGVW